MKSKQLLLIAVLIVVLAIAWMAVLGAASDKEIIETQNALCASGDAFAEKDLYIRAIPKYEEALTYETDNNRAIEEKLLAVYYEYGDMDSYLELSQSRMDAGYAPESEYVTMAEIYFARGDVEAGAAAAKRGIALFDSEACRQLYESNRYAYEIRFTGFDTVLATSSGGNMPAKDADGWTVISAKGKSLFGTSRFDYVSRFNSSGYAVVNDGEGYYVITTSGDKFSIDETGLSSVLGITSSRIIGEGEEDGAWGIYNADFVLKSNTYEELTLSNKGILLAKTGGKWGVIDEGGTAYGAAQFDSVEVNSLGEAFSGGLAAVQYGDKWYYINTSGGNAVPGSFAGARAPEDSSGYLAVANDDGKWGFIDRAGNLVIDYQYDDAKSFSENLAAVKVGDEWCYISAAGEVVISSVFYDAGAFHGGVAVADTPNGAAIIKLEYPGI